MHNPKLSLRHLLIGALLAIWCAALSGVALRLAPQALLALHLIASIGGVLPIAAYLSRHWWPRRHKIKPACSRSHASRNAIQGYFALACLALLALTGLALIHWTNVPALRWLHTGATAVLLLDLAAHTAWRWRQRGINTQEQPSLAPANVLNARAAQTWQVSGLVAACGIGALALVTQVSATPVRETQVPLEHAGLGTSAVVSAQDCELCHSDITQQWRRSGHARAATDVYYQAVATLFMEERGAEALRFCAACHNPIGLMQGEVDISMAESVKAEGDLAYQARQLGVSLPISQRAAEGVTCALCHQALRVATHPANGSLELDASPFELPTDAFARLSLRAVPDAHRDTLLRPVIRQAELCGSCHNLWLPSNGLAVEPTFDEWQASPYPERGITCQTCHFPQTPGSKADSSPVQTIGAHGNLPGAVNSLPGFADDTTLLRTAATLSAQLAPDPADPVKLMATVIITNTGAGHHLPTGANDLRQMWLEVSLRDDTQQVLWSSGVLDSYGALEPGAVQFHKVLGDANGRPIDLHRIWIATQVLTDTSLQPLEARTFHYSIPLSADQVPLSLTVRLLYRDVSQAFAEFALDRAVPDLPTREMARVDVDLK